MHPHSIELERESGIAPIAGRENHGNLHLARELHRSRNPQGQGLTYDGVTMRSFLATAIACGLLLSPGQRDAAADAAAAASYRAAAASYYRAALRGDPRNNALLRRTCLAVLANGEVEESVKLAERILQVDKNDRIARLVLGVRAVKQKQYPLARKELAQSIRGPITDLAATLLSAWTMANPSEAKQAIDSIDKLAGAEWYAIFKELHAALILDVAGQKKDAAKHFERAYKLDPTALRVVQAYGSFLARQGNTAEALKVFAAFDEARPRHPLIVEAVNELKAGKTLPMMVDTPQAGAAEVLYELGAALGRRGGEDLALIYLQLSLYLAPSHPLALLSLGDLPPKGFGAALGRRGREDLALIYLQLSLYLAPSYPLALLSLGDLYEAMPPKVRVDDGLMKSKDFKRYVASGTSTKLGFYTALNPDCTAQGFLTIRVAKQPEHGSVEIVETISFPNYVGSFSKCNQHKVKGVLVTYKSAPKFIGSDAVDLLALMPGGFAWENHFDISVR